MGGGICLWDFWWRRSLVSSNMEYVEEIVEDVVPSRVEIESGEEKCK